MKFNEERKLCIISEGFNRERKKKEVYRQEHTEAFHLILCSSSEKAVSFVLKAKLLYAFNNTFYIVFNKNNLSPLTFVSYNIFLCKEEKILLSMARRQFCFLWRGENSIWVTKACVLTKLIALYWKVSNGKWAVCQKQDGALQETTVQSNFETLRSALKRSYESQT